MLIVDAQIHLWEKGTPSPPHRQEPYSAAEAIAAMDEAGVDRALIHPVLWDPDSNELAIEAVRKYPDRFRIMGWFYLDDPNGSGLVAHWKERPGMVGLRFYFNERHKREWMTDGSLDWLWPAAERAGVPVALAAALFLPTVGEIAERHPGQQRRCRLPVPARAAGARQIPERRGQGDGSSGLRGGRLSVPQLP
jgi:predicted TIM-barrel fold metal-dependent hydrolase